MKNKKEDTGQMQPSDWILCVDGVQILIEIAGRGFRKNFEERMKAVSGTAVDLLASRPDGNGYRIINGYRVREIFAGEESLTNLLTQYVARTVALHY